VTIFSPKVPVSVVSDIAINLVEFDKPLRTF